MATSNLLSSSDLQIMINVTSMRREQHVFNITGLSPGLTYRVSIAAVNHMGQTGVYSAESATQLDNYNGKYRVIIMISLFSCFT